MQFGLNYDQNYKYAINDQITCSDVYMDLSQKQHDDEQIDANHDIKHQVSDEKDWGDLNGFGREVCAS